MQHIQGTKRPNAPVDAAIAKNAERMRTAKKSEAKTEPTEPTEPPPPASDDESGESSHGASSRRHR